MNPQVLDACCGSRMFWFDRHNPNVVFVDKRRETHVLPDISSSGGSRTLIIDPDIRADFTALLFPDESFAHVVFDPAIRTPRSIIRIIRIHGLSNGIARNITKMLRKLSNGHPSPDSSEDRIRSDRVEERRENDDSRDTYNDEGGVVVWKYPFKGKWLRIETPENITKELCEKLKRYIDVLTPET